MLLLIKIYNKKEDLFEIIRTTKSDNFVVNVKYINKTIDIKKQKNFKI